MLFNYWTFSTLKNLSFSANLHSFKDFQLPERGEPDVRVHSELPRGRHPLRQRLLQHAGIGSQMTYDEYVLTSLKSNLINIEMKWLKLTFSLFKLITSHVKNQPQHPVQHGRRESRVWRRQTPNDDETAHLLLLHPVSRVQVVGMREQGSIHPKVWPDVTRCDQIVPGVTSWDQMVQGSARQGSRTRLKVGNGRVWLRHDSSHLRLADRHPFFSLLSHDLSHLANEASERL